MFPFWQNWIKLNKTEFVWSQHAFIFHLRLSSVFIFCIFQTSCQTLIKFHMFLLLQSIYFSRCQLFVMREISLLSLSAANHFWSGREQEAPGLSITHKHTHSHTHMHSGKLGKEWVTVAVISDISPDSGYPNLCTRLGTAQHPEPFRHTSLDRWIGEREGRGERQLRCITKERWIEKRRRRRVRDSRGGREGLEKSRTNERK